MTIFNAKTSKQFVWVIAGMLLLSACNSTDPTLGIGNQSASSNAPSTAEELAAVNDGTFRVYFAPIVGAPVASVTSLSSRLSAAAPENKVTLQPSASRIIEHEIRGYFSAMSQNGGTTVIHVWDVFDRQGKRVHRIQGQEAVQGAANDPWSAVPPETMQKIADTVLAEYAAWRGTSS